MILLGKIVLGMAGAGLAAAGVLCSEGLVQVQVIEKQPPGHRVRVVAPAMLAPVALRLAPQRDRAQATEEIQLYIPAVRAALAGLCDTHDMILVEVKGPAEHVQVLKLGGSIVVDVDDPAEIVHVSAPIRALSSTVEELAAAKSNFAR
jgi:hypothetical protein